MKWHLIITPKVQNALRTIHPEIKYSIREAFDDIVHDPWIGKPLRDELSGFLSFRTRRFRIVYRIKRELITIVVVGVGPRKTIYEELAAEIRSAG